MISSIFKLENRVNGFSLRSTVAFFIYAGLLTGGFIFASYIKDTPYLAFATQLTIGFGIYITKRLIQKQEKFNEEGE